MKVLFCLIAVTLLSSCSLAFGPQWRTAVKSGPRPGVSGAWQGTWHSEPTGHRGALRAVVDPASNPEGDHNFHYHATWGKVFSGNFDAVHRVTRLRDGSYVLRGQHRMHAWAGGLYTYEGTVKGDAFNATYRSSKDHGTFDMRRVTAQP